MTFFPEPIIWHCPSVDSSGSMPLGNGDIGVNVWVEQEGDLVFYLSKTDAWDESGRLLKLGRIRIRVAPNPFVEGAVFSQTLDLATGTIAVQCKRGGHHFTFLIWVDANRPVVRVQADADEDFSAEVFCEIWRNEKRMRSGAEAHSPIGLVSPQDSETVYPDRVLESDGESLVWCHRNEVSCWAETLECQDMGHWVSIGKDPLKDRTFGARVCGTGLTRKGSLALESVEPANSFVISVHALTAQTESLDKWVMALNQQADESDGVKLDDAYRAHCQWWQDFWQRSWIHVSGTAEAEIVSRGYQLQRFMNACAGRGAYPIKFNGSIFTVDAEDNGEKYDADYRRWGGGYWFQNTRLMYWSMIMAGDFDLMASWFQMYVDALPLAIERGKVCFGIDNAAMFPETMSFWGSFLNSNYGYQREGVEPGLSQNTYIRRYWQGMLELLAMLLDSYAVSQDRAMLREVLLKLAAPFIRFYRDYYSRRDDEGKMLLVPSQSLETWHEAVNPSPDIAGLRWVLDGLLKLSSDELSDELRGEWAALRAILPPLPTRTYVWQKCTEVLPALQYDQYANSENPALYSVFPYRLFGVGKPDIEIGLETWKRRLVKETGGWRQDAIQAALLGLTEEAQKAVVSNFSTYHEKSRFPAFWGPNFDWVPDQDHGSVACIALQRMLMQYDDGKIYLLPAWPSDWDVEFRLHAPGPTTIQGSVRNGKVTELCVTPEENAGKVVVVSQ